MSSLALDTRYPAPAFVRGADISAKAGLLLLLAAAILYPSMGNLEGKGATARAIGYPLLAFTVPLIWFVFWRKRASFPWTADLLVTITCFTDILGNRMDLYDKISWFDDWMHFMNTGMLAAAVILLTMHRSTPLGAMIERALAFGVTAALFWEVAEYYAFLRFSPERVGAYTDTLGDMVLGTFGCVVAAVIVHTLWQQGRLSFTAPQLERVGPDLVEVAVR